MEKDLKLKRELERLEEQKRLLEEQLQTHIASSKNSISRIKHDMGNYYTDFFTKKKNTDFVLYDRFPSADAFKMYVDYIDQHHPIYKEGYFNVKELAEIIKQLYQFKKQKEYQILTFGMTEDHGTPIYGGQSWNIVPHLYFLIGNERSLEPYHEFNGQFTNNEYVLPFMFSKPEKDVIALELNRDFFHTPSVDIEVLTGYPSDLEGKVNYLDFAYNIYPRVENFSAQKNIFPYHLNRHNYMGVKDTLDFKIHPNDSFIARVLLSICIYKKNNAITELSSDDYNHIFETIYGEPVDIIGQAEHDIPKSLIYVPNKQTNR